MRKKFVELCKNELKKNQNSYVLLGDIGVGGFVQDDETLPPRVLNMGIAEQALIGFASGLSSTEGNVIVHTISPFLVERAYEQIKLNCGYNAKKLVLVSANGPFDYEKLGPTHHCPADVNLLSLIPNVEIRTPSTVEDFEKCFDEAMESTSSYYIRSTSRSAVTNNLDIDPSWKKVVGAQARAVTATTALLCTGESLKFALEEFGENNNYDIFYTANPKSKPPSEINKYASIITYEPYITSEFLLDELTWAKNLTSYLFDKSSKKIIKKNLGWEDFK